MILTMTPRIDQLADVQDIVSILHRRVWRQEWDVKMHWVLLVITRIGLILVLGSLTKGLLRLIIKKAGDVSVLRALQGVFHSFKKGNGHHWSSDFSTDLNGKHLDAANPSAAQLEAAQRNRVHPQWMREDGSLVYPKKRLGFVSLPIICACNRVRPLIDNRTISIRTEYSATLVTAARRSKDGRCLVAMPHGPCTPTRKSGR